MKLEEKNYEKKQKHTHTHTHTHTHAPPEHAGLTICNYMY